MFVKVCVVSFFEFSGLRCKLTIMTLGWVLERKCCSSCVRSRDRNNVFVFVQKTETKKNTQETNLQYKQ